MNERQDTIFALSSGRPPAAIAVVRVSGPRAREALERLTGRVPEPRRAALALVRDPERGEAIDQALSLWFPGPASETGEDMAELQLHGGRAVIAAALEALGRLPGFRPAEAGEFTRRAFLNGRLDLTAVEGLADLIGAETEAQRRQAVRQLRGALGKRAEGWRAQLVSLQARIEAGLDFSDESDVPADLVPAVLREAAALREDIRAVLGDARGGERLREGLTIAIAGPPNAGKSTLFNWLAGREAAIVSPYPGTTRDVLEVHLSLGGYPVTVLDTAGMRESGDPVEREGIARARARAQAADLVLWVEDVSVADPPTDAAGKPPAGEAPVWRILNKADLLSDAALAAPAPAGTPGFVVSALTEKNLPQLLAALTAFAAEHLAAGEGALITRARHRHALNQTVNALEEMNKHSQQEDLLAEDLRIAATALGRLVGRIDVEDVLDAIFRDFCIGK
ncbi:MAG TPA: tRNA uridine-5-carboxymethylaminomethyl(34) synthesis GTPase MnmE [Xanthobacteraceae bacterium]|nr:tRNA uridine-5-carboxymethylaminomethyl(34) synthesis GTPase MnmE [Xanthobacteraceae bacterium]